VVTPDTGSGHGAYSVCSVDALSDRAPLSAGHVAVVVAYRDDETIGCGAQLPRFPALRGEEFCQAMVLASVLQQNMVKLGISDQAVPAVLDAEYFRPASRLGFRSLPNTGCLLCERHDWG
jgi:hypothetical protein